MSNFLTTISAARAHTLPIVKSNHNKNIQKIINKYDLDDNMYETFNKRIIIENFSRTSKNSIDIYSGIIYDDMTYDKICELSTYLEDCIHKIIDNVIDECDNSIIVTTNINYGDHTWNEKTTFYIDIDNTITLKTQ